MSLATILEQYGRDVVQVTTDTPVGDVVALLADRRIGAVPVVSAGRVVGILSERDVIYAIARDGAGILGWPLDTAGGLEAMNNCAWAAVAETGAGRLRLSAYNHSVVVAPPD